MGKNSNMRTIQRRGKTTASAYGVIDNLTMTYSGNQLTNVADAGTTVTIAESNDFKKGSSTNPGYAYNKNGAMTKDLNKNISSISYNFLNLPARVSISGVHHDYTYSADGRKLKVVQGSLNRDYVGGVIYETGSLKRILIDGGYIEGTTYHYYLNDHQGNTGVVASGTGTIHQRNHYYPFGMPFADTSNTEQDKQHYKYGGKEYERANGLKWFDFESRQMDPAFGRFTTMDPLAEKYYGVSPYVYCLNNPILYIDPTGESVHLNRLGYVVQEVDDGDDGVYTHNDLSSWDSESKLDKSGKGISNIGNLGEILNIDEIYSNLLDLSSSQAKSIWNPFTFRNKVKTGGEWDLKNNKNTIYSRGETDGKTKYSFKGGVMESQDVGNHHFGVVVKAYNIFSEETILRQAGAYQIQSGTSRPEWQIYTEVSTFSPTTGVSVTTRIMLPPYGDDPRDQKWIKSGFNYYKTRKR